MYQWHTLPPPTENFPPKFDWSDIRLDQVVYGNCSAYVEERLGDFYEYLKGQSYQPPKDFKDLGDFITRATKLQLISLTGAGWKWEKKPYVPDQLLPRDTFQYPRRTWGINRDNVWRCCGYPREHPGCWTGPVKYEYTPFVINGDNVTQGTYWKDYNPLDDFRDGKAIRGGEYYEVVVREKVMMEEDKDETEDEQNDSNFLSIVKNGKTACENKDFNLAISNLKKAYEDFKNLNQKEENILKDLQRCIEAEIKYLLKTAIIKKNKKDFVRAKKLVSELPFVIIDATLLELFNTASNIDKKSKNQEKILNFLKDGMFSCDTGNITEARKLLKRAENMYNKETQTDEDIEKDIEKLKKRIADDSESDVISQIANTLKIPDNIQTLEALIAQLDDENPLIGEIEATIVKITNDAEALYNDYMAKFRANELGVDVNDQELFSFQRDELRKWAVTRKEYTKLANDQGFNGKTVGLKWCENSCWIDTIFTSLFLPKNTSLIREILESPKKLNLVGEGCVAQEYHDALLNDIFNLQNSKNTVESVLRTIWYKCVEIPVALNQLSNPLTFLNSLKNLYNFTTLSVETDFKSFNTDWVYTFNPNEDEELEFPLEIGEYTRTAIIAYSAQKNHFVTVLYDFASAKNYFIDVSPGVESKPLSIGRTDGVKFNFNNYYYDVKAAVYMRNPDLFKFEKVGKAKETLTFFRTNLEFFYRFYNIDKKLHEKFEKKIYSKIAEKQNKTEVLSLIQKILQFFKAKKYGDVEISKIFQKSLKEAYVMGAVNEI